LKKGKKGKPRFPRFFSLDKIFSTFSLSRAPFSAFSRGFLQKKKKEKQNKSGSPPARARVIDAQKTDHRKKKE
jgi:hypothetical protein